MVGRTFITKKLNKFILWNEMPLTNVEFDRMVVDAFLSASTTMMSPIARSVCERVTICRTDDIVQNIKQAIANNKWILAQSNSKVIHARCTRRTELQA